MNLNSWFWGLVSLPIAYSICWFPDHSHEQKFMATYEAKIVCNWYSKKWCIKTYVMDEYRILTDDTVAVLPTVCFENQAVAVKVRAFFTPKAKRFATYDLKPYIQLMHNCSSDGKIYDTRHYFRKLQFAYFNNAFVKETAFFSLPEGGERTDFEFPHDSYLFNSTEQDALQEKTIKVIW